MDRIMRRIKIYRVVGWLFLIYGTLGYLGNLLFRGLHKAEVFFYPTIFGALNLYTFPLNIFLWIGLILLWRADRNEDKNRKSIWLRFIRIYIIFSLIALIVAMAVIPYLIKRSIG